MILIVLAAAAQREEGGIPQTSLVSLLLPPASPDNHRGQLQGESATHPCDSPSARRGRQHGCLGPASPHFPISRRPPIGAHLDPPLVLFPSAVSHSSTATNHTPVRSFQLPTSPLLGVLVGDGGHRDSICIGICPAQYPASHLVTTIQRAILGNCHMSWSILAAVAWRGCWRRSQVGCLGL